MKRVRVFISGRVQGVSFRAHTKHKAEELGLVGWVKNLSDGRVEAVFEGDEKTIHTMIAWCKNEGSPASTVTHVEVCTEPVMDEWDRFTIRKE